MREWFYPSKRRQTGLAPGTTPGTGLAAGASNQTRVSQGKTNHKSSSTTTSSTAGGATGLSPPFHVDTHLALKRMLKAASQGKLSPKDGYASSSSSGGGGGSGVSGGGNKGSISGNRDASTRWSLDGSLSRFAAHALHPYLPHPHPQLQLQREDKDLEQHQDKGSNNSLLRTLQVLWYFIPPMCSLIPFTQYCTQHAISKQSIIINPPL